MERQAQQGDGADLRMGLLTVFWPLQGQGTCVELGLTEELNGACTVWIPSQGAGLVIRTLRKKYD